MGGSETPGGPWLNSPDISTLRIRIGDERLMLASRSTGYPIHLLLNLRISAR